MPSIRRALLRDDERREPRDQHDQDQPDRRELHGERIRTAPGHDRRDEREGVAHALPGFPEDIDIADMPTHVATPWPSPVVVPAAVRRV